MSDQDWLYKKRLRDVPWMTHDQWACYLLAAEFFGGFHHMIDKPKPWGNGIKLSERFNWLSTYDFDGLTRLVFMAHDACIRIEIMPSGPGLIGLTLYKRHQREGGISERHPTIEEALATWRMKHPAPAQ